MIYVENNLYMTIQDCLRAPAPYPSQSGFSSAKAYRVLGMYTASESAEAYVILSNDREELWFISNRHLRVAGVFKSEPRLNFEHMSEKSSHSALSAVVENV